MDDLRNFGILLKDTARLYTRYYERFTGELGITFPKAKVLGFLVRNEGVTQARLAEITLDGGAASAPGVAVALECLESGVRRSAGPAEIPLMLRADQTVPPAVSHAPLVVRRRWTSSLALASGPPVQEATAIVSLCTSKPTYFAILTIGPASFAALRRG